MDFAKKLLFMPKVLDYLSSGSLFRTVVGRVLQLAGVLVAIGGLIGWFQWAVHGFENVPSKGILGLIILLLAILTCIYVIAHTLWIRGGEIANAEDSEIFVLPIVIKIIRMFGDIGGTCLAIIGVAGCLGSWLAFGALSDFRALDIPGLDGDNFFFAGLACLAACWAIGFMVAMGLYLYAELLNLFVSMAQDLSAIRGQGESGSGSSSAAPPAPPAAPSSDDGPAY
jgi:hypothetical protein